MLGHFELSDRSPSTKLCNLQWLLIIAEVAIPIIVVDVLQHFGLLIDLTKRCLLDPVTNITVHGRASVSDIRTNRGYYRI